MTGKNLRLLGQEESPNRQPSIQEIIGDLQKELAKGETVYTAAELRKLAVKLADYEQLLINLMEH